MNVAQTVVRGHRAQPRMSMVFGNQKVYDSTTSLVSQSVLDEECMPLEVAMEMLRQRAQTSFRSGCVRVIRKHNNTQHAPMAFVNGVLNHN